ncbi:MAG: methyl-accepting chemotaxis protein [Pseudomonadota bacterium]
MRLSDWSIGTRLAGGFGLLMIMAGAMAGAGVWRLHSAGALSERMAGDASVKERLAGEWESAVGNSAARVIALAFRDNHTESEDEARRALEVRQRNNEIQAQLGKLLASPAERALLAQAADTRKVYAGTRDQVFALVKAGDSAGAHRLVEQHYVPQFQAYIDAVHRIGRHEEGIITALRQEMRDNNDSGQAILLALGALAVLFGAALAYVIGHSITAPLRRALVVAQAVAAGELGSRIDASGRDEAGRLLAALRDMDASLARIVGQVRASTDTITTAAAEIASGNMDLSGRTEEQAGALEETAASMEELTSTVQQNSENALRASTLAGAAAQVAREGGDVVQQVVATMEQIDAAARKIVDITSVIDGIAFQTNILALNAAVEAARAGEQGRGFAVVAAEVRSLAQRSGLAAREIKVLIDDSALKVAAGTVLAARAGSTMAALVDQVQSVSLIVTDIAAASVEQTAGIGQVNRAIGQMDQVTQQNAALVEESAAAAAAMREQAQGLSEAVSVFRLAPASGLHLAAAARPAIALRPPAQARQRHFADV